MIRQRDFLGRNRDRIALLAVLGAIVMAVGLEHAGLGHGGAADMDADHGAGDIVVVCLAVIGLGGAARAIARPLRSALPRPALAAGPVLGSGTSHRAPIPFAARAGPQELQVFRR